MDYEKKYKEALERARQFFEKPYLEDSAGIVGYIFPELKESEDERIRKELIEHVKDQQSSFISAPDCRDKYEEEENNKYNSWIAWLEKQGDDKVVPKFKIGDWVVFNNKHQSIYQVEKIEDGYYILRHTHGGTFRVCVLHDKSLRPWTIQDAKDGDVLATKAGGIFIYKELLYDKPFAYCGVDKFGVFKDCNCGKGLDWTPYLSDVTPATKEQRDTLEKAITNASYRWDKEKLKLEKV